MAIFGRGKEKEERLEKPPEYVTVGVRGPDLNGGYAAVVKDARDGKNLSTIGNAWSIGDAISLARDIAHEGHTGVLGVTVNGVEEVSKASRDQRQREVGPPKVEMVSKASRDQRQREVGPPKVERDSRRR